MLAYCGLRENSASFHAPHLWPSPFDNIIDLWPSSLIISLPWQEGEDEAAVERCVVQAKEGARERLQAVRGKIARVQQKFGGSSAAGSSKELRSGELRRRAPRPRSNNGIRRPASRHGSHSDGGHHPGPAPRSELSPLTLRCHHETTRGRGGRGGARQWRRRGCSASGDGDSRLHAMLPEVRGCLLQCQWRWRQSSARDAT